MADFILAVGDIGAVGGLVLHASTQQGLRVPRGGTGQAPVASTDTWQFPVQVPVSAAQPALGTVPRIQVPLPLNIFSSAPVDDLFTYVRAVYQKAAQANAATGVFTRGTPVTLGVRLGGATDYVYYDVEGGVLIPFAGAQADLSLQPTPVLLRSTLTLTCLPFPRGAPLTDATTALVTNGSAQSQSFRRGVPGDVRALTRYVLTDGSTNGKFINAVTVAVKSFPGLKATDATLVYTPTIGSDATQPSGTYFRATLSAAWKNIAAILSGVGAGLFHVVAEVRDATAALGNISAVTAAPSGTGGTLPPGTYMAYMTTTDGTNESVPIALPQAIVPFTAAVGSLGAESGDMAGFTVTQVLTGANRQNLVGNINATAAAARPAISGPLSAYGYRALAANGGGIQASVAIPNLVATASMRCDMRINTNTGSAAGGPATSIPLLTGCYLSDLGAGWGIALAAGGALLAAALDLPEGDWFKFEVTCVTNAVTVYINDVSAGSATIVGGPPANALIGAITTGLGPNLSVDFDNVQVSNAHIGANAGSIVYSWTAATGGGTGYNLYVTHSSGAYQKIPIATLSTATYTLTSPTAGTFVDPPTAAPVAQPALLRLRYGVVGGTLITQPVATPAAQSNSRWERLLIATVALPPAGYQEGAGALPWTLTVQGLDGGTAGPTLDIYHIWLIPADELDNQVECRVQGAALAALGKWVIDVRHDGEVSCVVYDAATGLTVIAQPDVSGKLLFGPGDNAVINMVEVTDGSGHFVMDTTDAKFTTADTIRPRFQFPQGRQPIMLTVSGNEVTDITRWRNSTGDGQAYPDGTFGIWAQSVNLVGNGSFETNLTGSATQGTGVTRTQDATHAKFGSFAQKVVTGASAFAGVQASNVITWANGATLTGSVWVYGTAGTVIRLVLYDGTTTILGPGGNSGAALAVTGWNYLTVTGTTVSASGGAGQFILDNGGGAAAMTIWVDGVQVEVAPFARPFAGDGATRNAARVQAPVGYLSPAQGWWAKTIRAGWTQAETGVHTLFSLFKDANNYVRVYWDGAGHFVTECMDASVSLKATSASQTFAVGATLCVVASWTTAGPNISVGGVAFVSTGGRGTPFTAPVTLDIGSQNNTQQEDASDYWNLGGTGTLTNADATTLNALGSTDPNLHTLGRAAVVTFSWTAQSDQADLS